MPPTGTAARRARPGAARWLLAAALLPLLAGCSGGTGDDIEDGATPEERAPVASTFPTDVEVFVDQARLQRVGREAFVRLVNGGDTPLTVTGAVVTSPRFADVTWRGEKTFSNEADLDITLPATRCGTGSDAAVRLTYRVGDEVTDRVSDVAARDRYGAIGLLMDRDCAQQTLEEAASLEVGDPVVTGAGTASTFSLPVTLTPTGERADVTFEGFDGTVLFSQTAASAALSDEVLELSGGPRQVTLTVVPARCDPHALAEDKVGTLFPVRVGAPDLPDGATFYLPLPDDTRAALRGFFSTHCGLTT